MSLQQNIEHFFEERLNLSPESPPSSLIKDLSDVMAGLDSGRLRVAEPLGPGQWQVHEWIKKAILLYFRVTPSQRIEMGALRGYDKVPLKFLNYQDADFFEQKLRVVPPAAVRYGVYVGPDTVLMPSYINIGAYIDQGAMIDGCAMIGSCAQIGKNVHVASGAGIGGVLEPLQARPTIIEDDCFIGALCEIAEGVCVERGSVIGMGTCIGQSTKIYDRETGEIYRGRVPEGSVVVPGSLPGHNGQYHLAAAIIVKRVDEATRKKTGVNDLLRYAQEQA